VETTVRPSLAFYNTFGEIDQLATVVRRLASQRRAG
jgi:cysteine desulfurase/selenocysteine lyase